MVESRINTLHNVNTTVFLYGVFRLPTLLNKDVPSPILFSMHIVIQTEIANQKYNWRDVSLANGAGVEEVSPLLETNPSVFPQSEQFASLSLDEYHLGFGHLDVYVESSPEISNNAAPDISSVVLLLSP